MRLLLAEDEADLAEALGVLFEKNHFSFHKFTFKYFYGNF